MRAPVVLLVLPCALLVSAVIEIRVSPPRHGRLCSYQIEFDFEFCGLLNHRSYIFPLAPRFYN